MFQYSQHVVEGFSMNTVKNNTQRSNKLSAVLAVDGLEINRFG
jgi:hypothetical protein